MITGYYVTTNKSNMYPINDPCSVFYSTLYQAKEICKDLSEDSLSVYICACSLFIENSDIFDLNRSFHIKLLANKLPEQIVIDDELFTSSELLEYLEDEIYPPWRILEEESLINTISAAGFKGHVVKTKNGFEYVIYDPRHCVSVEDIHSFTKQQTYEDL